VAGQGDDGDVGLLLFQRPRGRQAVHARHRDVHHHDIGLHLDRELDGDFSVRGFGDDLHIRLTLDQEFQALPQDRVVVGDEDSQGRRHDHVLLTESAAVAGTRRMTVVPSPGADSI
jgi:hypothetical protein